MPDAEVYPSAPLAVVIVEIRHPAAGPISAAEFASLRRALAPVTPIQRNEQMVDLAQVAAGAGPVSFTRFISRDAHQSVSFRPAGIVVESTDYPGWSSFKELVALAVGSRQEIAPVDGLERVGLRYIDEVRPPEHSEVRWEEWISPELLGPKVLGEGLVAPITAHQGVAQFGAPPELTHTLRWGTGAGQAYVSTENLRRKAEPSGPFFLVDTDGAWVPPDGIIPELVPDHVMQTLESLH